MIALSFYKKHTKKRGNDHEKDHLLLPLLFQLPYSYLLVEKRQKHRSDSSAEETTVPAETEQTIEETTTEPAETEQTVEEITTEPAKEEAAPASPVEEPAEEPVEPPVKETVQPDESSQYTMGQNNATRQAKDYLNFTAFSRQGLIEQLEFEGYSTEDATFAVDHIEVDWMSKQLKQLRTI